MKKGIYWGSFLLAMFIFLITGPVHGSPQGSSGSPGAPNEIMDVPQYITFQAYIEIDDDAANEDLLMTFRFYDAAEGGDPDPDNTFTNSFTADDGVVTCSIPIVDAAFFDGTEKYVEIQIEDEILDDRIRITTTPFALRSMVADRATVADGVSNQPGVTEFSYDGTAPGLPLPIEPFVYTELSEHTIDAPADGYCIVTATCETQAFGAGFAAEFGVSSDSNSLDANQDVRVDWSGVGPPAVIGGVVIPYTMPVTVHGVFPVQAGSNEFYFLARMIFPAALGTWFVEDIQFTLLYVPAALGPVMLTNGSPTDEIYRGGERVETR